MVGGALSYTKEKIVAKKAAGVEFYDVKTRKKVSVDDASIQKTTFTTSTGQVRYALRGTLADKRVLTRFVSKADWDKASYKEAKPSKK